MSYIIAATANHIGMRRVRNRPTLGVFRAPAEMVPVSQLFGTRALHGMGDDSAASTTPTTAAAMASPTPTTQPGPHANYILAREQSFRAWQQAAATAAQQTPTPQTTAPAAPSTAPLLTSGAAPTTPDGTPTVTVNQTGSDWAGEITAWLQSSSIWASVPNFWLVAGVGVAGLWLWPRGRR